MGQNGLWRFDGKVFILQTEKSLELTEKIRKFKAVSMECFLERNTILRRKKL
jgi:hypothetical protein